MVKPPHTIGLVVDPLALIDIAISMDQLSLPVRLIIPPLTFIATAIGPQLGAHTVSHPVQPLSSVSGTIAQGEGTLGDASEFIHLFIGLYIGSCFTKRAARLPELVICVDTSTCYTSRHSINTTISHYLPILS